MSECYPIVRILWDIQNVNGNSNTCVCMARKVVDTVKRNFVLGPIPRIRKQVFYFPNSQSSEIMSRRCSTFCNERLKTVLHNMKWKIIDGCEIVKHSETSIHQELKQIEQDCNPEKTIVVFISGDGRYADSVYSLCTLGFQVQLMANAKSMSAKFFQLNVQHLDIWNMNPTHTKKKLSIYKISDQKYQAHQQQQQQQKPNVVKRILHRPEYVIPQQLGGWNPFHTHSFSNLIYMYTSPPPPPPPIHIPTPSSFTVWNRPSTTIRRAIAV